MTRLSASAIDADGLNRARGLPRPNTRRKPRRPLLAAFALIMPERPVIAAPFRG